MNPHLILSLTKWSVSVHSLDVHQARQISSHSNGVGPGVLVGSLDAAALPVRPVYMRAQKGQTIGVLDGSHKGASILPIQVSCLNALQ